MGEIILSNNFGMASFAVDEQVTSSACEMGIQQIFIHWDTATGLRLRAIECDLFGLLMIGV